MRIIIANDTYYPNVDGCSYFSQRLAHYLKENGHTVLVIAPGKTRHTEYSLHDGIPIFGLYSLPVLFHKDYRFSPPIFIKGKILSAMKEFKPDIVHVQGHFYIERTVAAIARKLRIPVIGTNHFMPENLSHYVHTLHAPDIAEKWVISFLWRDFRKVFEKLDLITTPTKTAAAMLQKIRLSKAAIPLSCGVDLKKFNPKNDGRYLVTRYHMRNKPILLCVARLAPEKNIDFVMRAFALAVKKVPMQLALVGGGMERKNLEELARDLGIDGCVTFTGFLPDEDLPNIYTTATAFVVAGSVELQSLVTMEAMASGLPVIAANKLALPELVHHGKNGFLFELDDVCLLANYMERIVSNEPLRRRMSEASLATAKSHDIRKTIRQFEKLYESLITAYRV